MNTMLAKNRTELSILLETLESLDAPLSKAAEIVASALGDGKKLLACGNGGSASDASHLTTEFVSRFDRERKPSPAISLSVHGGDLTAIGNDYDFQDVFARQVNAFGVEGDVLIVFTSSGNSENVRRALIQAKSQGLRTIAFLGRTGGNSIGIADVDLLPPGEQTARIQELHKLLLHTLCEIVEEKLERQFSPTAHAARS